MRNRKGGRAVYCTGFEYRRTFGFREFESRPFRQYGEMAEWFIAAALKPAVGETPPRVRISFSPPIDVLQKHILPTTDVLATRDGDEKASHNYSAVVEKPHESLISSRPRRNSGLRNQPPSIS